MSKRIATTAVKRWVFIMLPQIIFSRDCFYKSSKATWQIRRLNKKQQAHEQAHKGRDDSKQASNERLVDVETDHAAGAGEVHEGAIEAAAHVLQRCKLW